LGYGKNDKKFMILFLNFAPIEFMGGAEKWMMDISSFFNKTEPTTLVSVAQKVSNIYGQLVLQRRFNTRAHVDKKSYSEKIDLGWNHFLPFSQNWKKARTSFQKARIIYIKFEIMELIILLYFGGFGIFKKTIAGLHSPFLYYKPSRFLDSLHNFFYSSIITKYFLSKMRTIHVMNNRDQKFLQNTFLLEHVVTIPNGVKIENKKLKQLSNDKKLHVLFTGELSERKGVDILLDVIKNAPDYFQFNITSDGPMKELVKQLASQKNNCTYHGYVSNEQKEKLYQQADVLMLPSRGEGFPLVILDAMAHGLLVVDSQDIRLDLPEYIEYTSKNNVPEEYIFILNKIYHEKQNADFLLHKKRIFDYCVNNLSDTIIFSRLREKIFSHSK